ncbi:MAG: hypothetical protein MR630_10330 [Selenomonas sp.]|uniref:hypothetical protein n=1 Tax=Selenomonas sp. TaxID=2053611 RepID=UPI0025E98576|nr:hypothetical protein [Selenomonas sp.]MCI6101014.1 hypothetical protein [Selenomonas sp.]MCI6232986.1 hypothetical protein [Selenomonas sp.]
MSTVAVFFIIHAAVVLLWFFVASRFRTRQQAAVESILVLLLPVFGVLILFSWRVVCRLFHYDVHHPEPLEDDRDDFSISTMDYQADIVPLSDTYLLGDARMKRRLFTNAIKQEVVENPDILREAVRDEDREITYYAVSMMTARMGKVSDDIDAAEQELSKDLGAEEREGLLTRYADLLEDYLKNGYGDADSRAAKEQHLLETLAELVRLEPDIDEIREQQIRAQIRAKAFDEAHAACKAYEAERPQAEGPVYLRLMLAVAERDDAGVRTAVKELRALPVRLSPEALTAIRYWGGKARNE